VELELATMEYVAKSSDKLAAEDAAEHGMGRKKDRRAEIQRE
jgi:hypothetical protein